MSVLSTRQILFQFWQQRSIIRVLVGRQAAAWLAVGAFAGLASAVVEVLLSVQVAQMLTVIGIGASAPPAQSGVSLKFVGLLVGIGILRGLSYFLISQSGTNAHEAILLRLRLFVFHETFRGKTGYVSLARLTYLLAEIFPKATLFCLGVAVFIPNLIQLLVVCGIMFLKSWLLTALGFVGIALIGLMVHSANVKVRSISSVLPAQFDALASRMTRMARNWFFLRAVRKMEDEHAVLAGTAIGLGKEVMRSVRLGNVASILPQSLGVFVVVGVVALQTKYHLMDASDFISFLYLFFRFIQVLGLLATNYSSLNSNIPQFFEALAYVRSVDPAGVHHVVDNLRSDPRGPARVELTPRSDAAARATAPLLELTHVSFRYGPDERNVLENFSLKVGSGERVALMGPSGSGKSTILALSMGVLLPLEGSVRIGGMDPEAYFRAFGSRLGYVGAEPYLVDGTVEANLRYGLDRHCSREEQLEVLHKVGLGSWLKGQSDPLGYVLREAGEGLSTGQKQRLMLARALLRQPVLIVLDEMSANLDQKSEQEIKELIHGLKDCTILTVTHRPDFVTGTHRIVELSPRPV